MSIEALKEAKSVIGSINSGKANALTIGGETVYWQREEWVRWALDEVLPQLEKAIDAAQELAVLTDFKNMSDQIMQLNSLIPNPPQELRKIIETMEGHQKFIEAMMDRQKAIGELLSTTSDANNAKGNT